MAGPSPIQYCSVPAVLERSINPHQMIIRKITTLLAAAVCATCICGPAAFASGGGIVIYKDFSFDPDSQAEITDYASFDRYSSVDNVLTPAGHTLRITPDQEPIYIPHAGSPQSNGAAVARTILAAERRFPQFAPKLEAYRRDWAAIPISTPTPQPNQSIAAAPQTTAPAEAQDATPAGDSTRVLQTKSGETLTDWKISAMEGDTVVITHADGISRIPITDLPDNLFGFPPAVMARAQQLRQQAADPARIAPALQQGGVKPGTKGPPKANHHRPRPIPESLTWN